MQVDYDDEVCFHAVRALYDHARDPPRRPVLPRRLVHPPARPLGAPGPLVGALRPGRHRPARGPADPVRRGRPAQPPAAGHVPASTPRTSRTTQIRRARHAYFAAISYVDDRIGQVLGALRESGLEDDTIVVLTADHGEMLGERGLWYKMAFFEASARVPLVVCAPGGLAHRGASRSRSRCSTSPRRCSTSPGSTRPISARSTGRSLAPVLRGEGRPRRAGTSSPSTWPRA